MRRIGIYVDASNISMNGGNRMRYDILRNLACRAGGDPQRLNVYAAFDPVRAETDPEYAKRAKAYQNMLREQGFRVSVKTVSRFINEEGQITFKSNTDLEMAVDILTESARLDTVLLCTGDGDFAQVVRAIQSQGCRVELVAFQNVSRLLRNSVDEYINGFMVPDLVFRRDNNEPRNDWGKIGQRVRGFCKQFDASQGFGFMSYWASMPTAKIASTELTSAYFRVSQLADRQMSLRIPSRSRIFEFELASPIKPDGNPEARNINLISDS